MNLHPIIGVRVFVNGRFVDVVYGALPEGDDGWRIHAHGDVDVNAAEDECNEALVVAQAILPAHEVVCDHFAALVAATRVARELGELAIEAKAN